MNQTWTQEKNMDCRLNAAYLLQSMSFRESSFNIIMTRVGGGDEDIETQSLKYEAHTYKRVFSHLYMYYIILVSKGKFI